MADQEAHTAAEKLRKRLRNGGAMQPLFDQVLAKFDEYEQALTSSKVLTSSVQSSIRIRHDVPSQREMNVASDVFNTAELLEQILLNVPVTHLLRAQGVCRQFRKSIIRTASLVGKMAPARIILRCIQPRTIRHLGEGPMVEPETNFHHFAVLRPQEWRMLESSTVLDETYVAHPSPKGFMIRQICLSSYFKRQTDPVVVAVACGVKFKHVFAALHDLFWDGTHRKRVCGGDSCRVIGDDHVKDRHLIQVDICWDEYWENRPRKHGYTVYDGRDGNDFERWRRWLRWEQEPRNWLGHKPTPEP